MRVENIVEKGCKLNNLTRSLKKTLPKIEEVKYLIDAQLIAESYKFIDFFGKGEINFHQAHSAVPIFEAICNGIENIPQIENYLKERKWPYPHDPSMGGVYSLRNSNLIRDKLDGYVLTERGEKLRDLLEAQIEELPAYKLLEFWQKEKENLQKQAVIEEKKARAHKQKVFKNIDMFMAVFDKEICSSKYLSGRVFEEYGLKLAVKRIEASIKTLETELGNNSPIVLDTQSEKEGILYKINKESPYWRLCDGFDKQIY